MGLFGRRKKKREAEQKRLEEQRLAKIAEDKRIEEEKRKKALEEKKKAETNSQQVKKVEVKAKPVKNPVVTAKAKVAAKTKATAKPSVKSSPSGKYEIYPEAGLYKYRLKASNGEILVVSYGYASKKGAKNGIETFIKAVETGNFEISTDKVGFSHFDLFGARGARVIAAGEFYKTVKLAESAVESVKKFYLCDKIVELAKIPQNEMREVLVENLKVEEKPNGKYQLSKEGDKAFFIKLVASNGQVLLVSQKYASKQSALNGLESIKNAIENQNFTVSKDKQERYQYKLYTSNKQLIVSGETYPQRANCLSSVESVIRFSGLAKTVEL
ncbi:MAG: DUF1508 domain-containing protein [Tenericutes bacterium]|nr:DUF1508 domain-containing protein [Mycoplasmatota bacterium]